MTLLFFKPYGNRLCDLKNQLEGLDKLFLEHQWALMEKKWETALERYEQMYELRLYHLAFMEFSLLPLFENNLKTIPRGARPLYFRREARLIRNGLKRYIRLFGRLYLHNKMETIDVPRLFDEYMPLKDLMDHHDAREKVFLFPKLDDALPAVKREQMLEDYRKTVKQLEKRWIYEDV